MSFEIHVPTIATGSLSFGLKNRRVVFSKMLKKAWLIHSNSQGFPACSVTAGHQGHWPLMKMERESVASEPGWLNQMAKTNKQETQWREEEKRPPPPTWSRRQHMSIQVTTKVCLPPKFPCTFHILTKYRLILLATLMHHQAE